MRERYSIESAYPEFFKGSNPLLVIEDGNDGEGNPRDDIKKMKDFLDEEGHELVAEVTANQEKYFKTYELDGLGYEYDMFFLPGSSRNTLVTSMEVATNIDLSRKLISRKDRLMHALAVRAFVDPEAALVIQSQTALTSRERSAMNFTDAERKILASGYSDPITHRIKETLRQEGRLHSHIHAFGSSLGGVIANDLATVLDNMASVTSFEAPDVKTRTTWDFIKEMSVSGPHLRENIRLGKLDAKVPELRQGGSTFAYWMLSLFHPDTIATINRMQHDTHLANLLAGLEKNPHMGVVHAWAASSAISPAQKNWEIVEAAKAHNLSKLAHKIQGFELTSPFAAHNSSNIPLAIAALVKRAMTLGKQAGSGGSIILNL